MFKKVLIVDDHDDINDAVKGVLDVLNINFVQTAQYCDEAYLKLKRAVLDKQPFDLIITDLSFKKDHRDDQLNSGEDLIAKLRQEFLELSIIVYSMKDQLQKVRLLMKTFQVNAYVCKDRKGSKELAQAIKAVYNGEQFLSAQVQNALSSKIDLNINNYDIALLKQLSLGHSKEVISDFFKKEALNPSSVSSIEKRQSKLLIQFKAQNATHLVSIAKDLGLI